MTAVREHYEAHPDPSPESCPIAPAQLDRIDDNLHFGWSWHRYRYCYRAAKGTRILDAGCGTGLSTLTLARLNPGSHVVGLDLSPRSVELARRRSQVQALAGSTVDFREHDLAQPVPGSFGEFDFVVCRGVLGLVDDPVAVLRNLAARLDARGLLTVSFPTRAGRHIARQFRRAVDALARPGMSLAERAQIGWELFQAFRPDHPIRTFERETQVWPTPDADRILSAYLHGSELRDWSLEEAIETIERAGLQYLYVAQRRPWQPDRVFQPQNVSASLKARVEAGSERARAVLMDALDASLHMEEYRIYACLPEFEPRLPGWPENLQKDPRALDPLIPHRTGLAKPANPSSDPAVTRGCVSYQVVTGALGEVDWRADALLRSIDDRASCGQLDQKLQELTGVLEAPDVRQSRWLFLANNGFVILESPDPRQHVDCRFLGAVRDRLDCPCPRRWIRACSRHEYCTIDGVAAADPARKNFDEALQRLHLEKVISCAQCPDYAPED